MNEIVARAGVSVGAYYARFATKEAVLDALYGHYLQLFEADDLANGAEADSLTLKVASRRFAEWVVRRCVEHRWLLRELALFSRQHPERVGESAIADRTRLLDRWREPLVACADEIGHEDASRAIDFAIYMVMTTARELTLFPHLPQARLMELSSDEIIERLGAAMHAYLRN